MCPNEGRVEKNDTLAVVVSESFTVVTFELGLLVEQPQAHKADTIARRINWRKKFPSSSQKLDSTF